MIAHSVSRRQMFGYGGATAVALMLGTGAWDTRSAYAAPTLKGDPFTLGVASGDPTPDGVVLWTRLTGGEGELQVARGVRGGRSGARTAHG